MSLEFDDVLSLEEVPLDIPLVHVRRQSLHLQCDYLHPRVILHLNQLIHFVNGHLEVRKSGGGVLAELREILGVQHRLLLLQHPLLRVHSGLFAVLLLRHLSIVQREVLPVVAHAQQDTARVGRVETLINSSR